MVQAGCGLHGLQFECAFLGRGLLLSLEVPTDTNAMKAAIDTKREHTIAILEPADAERIFVIHA